jgi:hypothetical protein
MGARQRLGQYMAHLPRARGHVNATRIAEMRHSHATMTRLRAVATPPAWPRAARSGAQRAHPTGDWSRARFRPANQDLASIGVNCRIYAQWGAAGPHAKWLVDEQHARNAALGGRAQAGFIPEFVAEPASQRVDLGSRHTRGQAGRRRQVKGCGGADTRPLKRRSTALDCRPHYRFLGVADGIQNGDLILLCHKRSFALALPQQGHCPKRAISM